MWSSSCRGGTKCSRFIILFPPSLISTADANFVFLASIPHYSYRSSKWCVGPLGPLFEMLWRLDRRPCWRFRQQRGNRCGFDPHNSKEQREWISDAPRWVCLCIESNGILKDYERNGTGQDCSFILLVRSFRSQLQWAQSVTGLNKQLKAKSECYGILGPLMQWNRPLDFTHKVIDHDAMKPATWLYP